MRKCKNCGAPVNDCKCEYCGGSFDSPVNESEIRVKLDVTLDKEIARGVTNIFTANEIRELYGLRSLYMI